MNSDKIRSIQADYHINQEKEQRNIAMLSEYKVLLEDAKIQRFLELHQEVSQYEPVYAKEEALAELSTLAKTDKEDHQIYVFMGMFLYRDCMLSLRDAFIYRNLETGQNIISKNQENFESRHAVIHMSTCGTRLKDYEEAYEKVRTQFLSEILESNQESAIEKLKTKEFYRKAFK